MQLIILYWARIFSFHTIHNITAPPDINRYKKRERPYYQCWWNVNTGPRMAISLHEIHVKFSFITT